MIRSRFAVTLCLSLLACADPRYGNKKGKDPELDAGLGSASQTARDAATVRPPSVAEEAGAAGGAVTHDASAALTNDSGVAPVGNPPVSDGAPAPNGDPPSDAGSAAVTSTVFPDWAEPLIGSYAARQFSFAKDRLGIVSSFEELALMQIVRVDSGAELRTKLCSMVATSTEDVLKLLDPSGLPETIRQVTFDDAGRWGTDARALGFGYERAVPAACVGKENQSIPKVSAQTWLTDTCRCPSSAEAAPRIDDCRVLDPDGDKKPGLSYSDKGKPGALIGSFINTTLHAVILSRTHAVAGRVDAQGAHHAQLVVDEVAYQLSCEPDCPQITDVGRPCTSEFNDLHLVPLTEQRQIKTCAELLARRAEVFPGDPPASPTSCSQQVLTDDPNRK